MCPSRVTTEDGRAQSSELFYAKSIAYEKLAGAAGFEPANVDTKNRCLTTWRRPKARWFLHRLHSTRNTFGARVLSERRIFWGARLNGNEGVNRGRFLPTGWMRTGLNRRRTHYITRRNDAPSVMAGWSNGPEKTYRSIAQPGSAPRSGRGGRVFESPYSDQ